MHSLLLYSFRTNPDLESFCSAGFNIFVFGKLKEDFKRFEVRITNEKPRLIIGLARTKTQTRIETRTVNMFGAYKKIKRDGKNAYPLHVPPNAPFPQSRKHTTSFCNWTIYTIRKGIDGTKTQLSFVHYTYTDLPDIIDFLYQSVSH